MEPRRKLAAFLGGPPPGGESRAGSSPSQGKWPTCRQQRREGSWGAGLARPSPRAQRPEPASECRCWHSEPFARAPPLPPLLSGGAGGAGCSTMQGLFSPASLRRYSRFLFLITSKELHASQAARPAAPASLPSLGEPLPASPGQAPAAPPGRSPRARMTALAGVGGELRSRLRLECAADAIAEVNCPRVFYTRPHCADSGATQLPSWSPHSSEGGGGGGERVGEGLDRAQVNIESGSSECLAEKESGGSWVIRRVRASLCGSGI